jgi:hypothetical protein
MYWIVNLRKEYGEMKMTRNKRPRANEQGKEAAAVF